MTLSRQKLFLYALLRARAFRVAAARAFRVAAARAFRIAAAFAFFGLRVNYQAAFIHIVRPICRPAFGKRAFFKVYGNGDRALIKYGRSHCEHIFRNINLRYPRKCKRFFAYLRNARQIYPRQSGAAPERKLPYNDIRATQSHVRKRFAIIKRPCSDGDTAAVQDKRL